MPISCKEISDELCRHIPARWHLRKSNQLIQREILNSTPIRVFNFLASIEMPHSLIMEMVLSVGVGANITPLLVPKMGSYTFLRVTEEGFE